MLDPGDKNYNRFKCFSASCDKSGDIIDFVKMYGLNKKGDSQKTLPYKEAVLFVSSFISDNYSFFGLSKEDIDVLSSFRWSTAYSNIPKDRSLFVIREKYHFGRKNALKSHNTQQGYFEKVFSPLGQKILAESIRHYQFDLDQIVYQKDQKQKSGEQLAYFHLRRYRGLSARTIRQFKLGYGRDAFLRDFLHQTLYDIEKDIIDQMLIDLRLCRIGKEDKLYEPHRNRIVFPIFDQRGRPLGLQSRMRYTKKRKNHKIFKYKNAFPSTGIIYGLSTFSNRLDNGALKVNKLFLAESIIDMLSLYDNGIKNSLSTLGSNFSERHFMQLNELMIKHQINEIIVCYDNDRSGLKGAENIRACFAAEDVIVKFANIPTKAIKFTPKEKKELNINDVSDVVRNGIFGESLKDYLLSNAIELSFPQESNPIFNALKFSFKTAARFDSKIKNNNPTINVPRDHIIAHIENEPWRRNSFINFLYSYKDTPLDRGMNIRIPIYFLKEIERPKLFGPEIRLFFYLKAKTTPRYPATFRNKTLCSALKVSERTLQRYKKKLCKIGLLHISRDKKHKHLCRYTTCFIPKRYCIS